MQGFNKYYPPDFDPDKHKSLNSYQGKHALGDRARKLDQGILITRFELPFNIWCLNCNNHIGMGVRYNAEKRKIGMYYSTPMFAFRCKCHLCSAWFEIQTDPKNTRYVVVSGARQKIEDWNPEENGGYAVHDSTAAETPIDPLASLEKTTVAKKIATTVTAPRIDELYDLSDKLNADPYAHSVRIRKYFRDDKKKQKVKDTADNVIKDKYSLPKELTLVPTEDVADQFSDEWDAVKQLLNQKAKQSGVATSFAEARRASATGRTVTAKTSSKRQVSTLSAVLLRNTARTAEKKKPPDTRSLGIVRK